MPTHKNIILKFNQYVKSDKTPRVIYADLEHLIKKIDGGYLMSTVWTFDNIENKHSLYRGEDFMNMQQVYLILKKRECCR